MKNTKKIIILVVSLFILLIWYRNYETPHMIHYKSSNSSNTTFIEKHPNFLNTYQCDYLTMKLKNHPENVVGAGLGPGFKNLQGFTTIFKDKVEAQHLFYTVLKIPLVWTIFEEITLPDSNAFVINTLVIKKSKKKSAAVYAHYDDTIDVESGFFKRDLTARFINILYVNVPKNMERGHFVAWQKGLSTKHEIARIVGVIDYVKAPKPKIKVKPEKGMYIKVRGDSFHTVEPFTSTNDDVRISLVIEEYICNESELSQVPDLNISSRRESDSDSDSDSD